MKRKPFKMRSGNSPLFKMMGASPTRKTVEASVGSPDATLIAASQSLGESTVGPDYSEDYQKLVESDAQFQKAQAKAIGDVTTAAVGKAKEIKDNDNDSNGDGEKGEKGKKVKEGLKKAGKWIGKVFGGKGGES